MKSLKLCFSVFIMLLHFQVLALEIPEEETYIYGDPITFDAPIRVHSVIASENGYYPSSIQMFRGEKLKLFVTGSDSKPNCLMIPEKKLFLSAEKGVIAEGEVTFDRPGVYKFFCPSKRKISGKIVVMRRKAETDKMKREIASKNQVKKEWYPKEKPASMK